MTLAQLNELHASATAALLEGKNTVIVASSAGGVNVARQVDIASDVFWDELNYALDLKSPSATTTPITRSRAVLKGVL